MDQKYCKEIKTRDCAALPDTDAPVFLDRHALIAEVERLKEENADLKTIMSPVKLAKIAMMQIEFNRLQAESATLRKALELACKDNAYNRCNYSCVCSGTAKNSHCEKLLPRLLLHRRRTHRLYKRTPTVQCNK